MPTMQQLPQVVAVDIEDELLLSQDGETVVVAIGVVLGAVQPRLTLAPGMLLGRSGFAVGGPEPIAVGGGLIVQSGTLLADETRLAVIDSPAFTGTPTAPTAPNGDSSDQLATTAFVQANLPRVVIGGDMVGHGSGTVEVALPTITAAGTYTAVTVNAKGLVTSGSTLSATDVDMALGYTPYNAANPAGFIGASGLGVFPAVAYGAFFNGTHDDQPGIAAAISAAHAAGGGTVLLPAGKGCIASTVVQPYDNVHLVGAGVANLSHNTTSSYDVGTVLSWTGAVGGTMATVGPARNLVNGRSISNADVRGVLFDCGRTAGVGVIIASVNSSTFDIGYYQPSVCGLKVTTALLQAQISAAAAPFEVNDSQHNRFRIQGYAVNTASTTIASAASLSPSVPVVNPSSLYPGLQVRIGSGLYIIQSVNGNTLTLTTPLAASDGAAGTSVTAAARGVWLQGLTTADFPAGYYGPGAASYPQLWNGNVSLNQFESVTLLHYTGGDGFTFGYADHNFVDKLTVYSLPGSNGVVFDGSAGLGQQSAQNQIGYCSAGRIIARGTISYPNTSAGTLADSAYASQDGYIGCLDTYNGTSSPVIEWGATLRFTTDTDFTVAPRFQNAVFFDAAWEPLTGTYTPDPATSLLVVNNSSDHIKLATGLGTDGWAINVDGSQGNLRVFPTGASANSTMVLGAGGAPVSILGLLSVGNGLNVAGASTISGALSVAAASVGNGVTVGGTVSAAALLAVAASVSGGLTVGGAASVTGGLSAGSVQTRTTLSVGGNASVAGALSAASASVSGAMSAAAGAFTGGLTVGGAATVVGALWAGTISTSSGLAIGGALSVPTASVTGALTAASASISSGMTVGGAASLAGALSVASATIANGVTVMGAASLPGTLSAGTLSVANGLSVGGATSLAGALTVPTASVTGTLSAATVSVANGLTIGGAASVAGTLSSAAVTITNGLTVGGAASIPGAVSVGTLSVANGLSVAGATAFSAALSAPAASVTGALSAATASISNALTVAGAASVTGTLTAATAAVTGNLTVGNAASIAGLLSAASISVANGLSVGGAGAFTGAVSAAFGFIAGAFTAGSASIASGVTIGGTASVTGALAAASAAIGSGLTVGSAATVQGALTTGSVSITGALTVGTTASIAGAVALAGSLAVAGAATVAGALRIPTPPASDSSTNAATTAWISAKGYLPQVPTLAALRATSAATLSDGATILLDAYATRGDGGAGLFTWNAASTVADNGGIAVNPTGNTGAGRWIRQLADGRVTPQMFGARGDGVTNDTAAFAAALLAGPVIVPAGTYRIANLAIPNGAWMEGGAGLGYSGDVATAPGSGQKPAVVSPVLLAVAGTTSCILNVYGCNDATLKGLFLDGGANAPTCDGVSSGSTQIMMERVTVVRCINGLGSVANTDLYTHVATLINCEFANNTNGMSNLIDTAVIGGAVSANAVGVNLGSGANANSFIAVRFEWSINDGVVGYNAASNVFCGGLFDRNAWRAVNLGAGCKDWTFVGVQFARNGSNATYPNNCHIALNGTTSVFFNGCVSRTGVNDDGTGTLSPAYFVNYINSNALVTISGCDVSGYVTGFAFGTSPTGYVQRDNFGAGDTTVNAARPYIAGGVVAQTLFTKAPVTIAPGASTTIALGQSPITTNYSTTTRTLHVTAVNNSSPYQSCSGRIALGFYRDTAVHAPTGSAAYGETGGTGILTWGSGGKLQLSATSVAADGSSWTLGVLNGGTADGSNWSVFAELH